MDKKIRLVIEVSVDKESIQEKGLTEEDVLDNIVLRDSDVWDGFDLTTNIPGFDNTRHFTLCCGEIVEKQIVSDNAGPASPLYSFIEQEVPFRMREIHNLLITEDEKDELADALYYQSDVMFDYDRLDDFLKDEYEDMPPVIKNAVYTSVWDGGRVLSSPCKVNLHTKEICEMQILYSGNDVDILEEEYVEIEGFEGEKFTAKHVNLYDEEDDEGIIFLYDWKN